MVDMSGFQVVHTQDKKPNQECVSWTATLRALHVNKHSNSHESKSENHDCYSEPEIVIFMKRVKAVKHLNEISCQKRVYNCPVTNPLSPKNIYYENYYSHHCHGKAIIQRSMIRYSHS